MDNEVVETLAYFRQNVSDLKNLGKEWGLSDSEIDECIQKAMSVDLSDLPAPNKTTTSTASSATHLKCKARKAWPKLRICVWMFCGFLMVLGIGAFVLEDEEIEHVVLRVLEPLSYPVLRSLRLMTYRLHNVFNMYDQFREDCVIDNPLFDKDSILEENVCEMCTTTKIVRQFEADSLDSHFDLVSNLSEPLLLKNIGRKVSLQFLQNVLSANSFAKKPMFGITTNLPWASQVADLLKDDVAEKLAAQPDFYFFWHSKLAWTSQIIKKVFPRPHVFGTDFYTVLRKSMFITGPRCEAFELQSCSLSHFNLYVQGSGATQLTLTPPEVCEEECSPMTASMSAGDILMFNKEIYTAVVQPVGNDIGISFLGHVFYYAQS